MEDRAAAEAAPLQVQEEAPAAAVPPCPAPATIANKSARQRLRWHPITTISVGGGAEMEGVTTHSFLKNRDNWMDIMLVRQLMVDQPFSVPFGRSGEAWRACARSLSLAKDPDGMLVFGKFGVSDKAIKKRFDDLMAFMKNHQDNVPFQSGCDDEPERTELQGALEDLYEIYTSVITELKEASNSAAAKKADDRQKAEALRNASLGILSPNEKSHYIANKKRNDSSSDSGGGRSEKKPRKTTRETRSIIDLTSARLEERTAIMLSKEARKKERQEFKAKQQELEFQFKVEQAEKAHELQRMQLELQTEMMRFFRQQNQPTADVEGKQNDSNSK